MKKLCISALALWMTISSAFAAYSPSMTEQKQVDAAGWVLLQIIDTKHDGNYELLLGVLKSFESQVASSERKTWILDTLISLTIERMWMMMKDNMMMDDSHSDTMMKDDDMMMKDDDMMMKDDMMDWAKVFDISWTNFAYSQDTITVHKGDTVTVNFNSASWFHDWVVDEFAAATSKVNPEDGTTSVTFVADTAWSFEYYCSVGNHRAQGMVGTLIVQDAMMDDMMMDDSHSDTMMTMDEMMAALVPLKNVTWGVAIRWVWFTWGETGSAINASTDNGNHVYATFQNLPSTGPNNFYEGWIVRTTGWHQLIMFWKHT